MIAKFLKPVVADVFIPALGRNILRSGETVEVTSYVERRIASGALKVAEKVVKKALNKADKLTEEDAK